MPKLKDSLTETVTFSGWAGSVSDLGPLLDLIERQFVDLRDGWIAHETEWSRRSVDRARRDVETATTSGNASWLARAEFELDAESQRLEQVALDAQDVDETSVMIRVKRGGERHTRGRAADISAYLLAHDVKDLTLRAPRFTRDNHRISVVFDHEDGVRLSVSSDDATWTSGAFAQLSAELRRRVPWWRWMRSLWFLIPATLLGVGFLVTSLADAALRAGVSPVIAGPGAITLIMAALILGPYLAQRALPAFQLTASKRPRGEAIVAFVGTLAVSVVVGIMVNWIS